MASSLLEGIAEEKGGIKGGYRGVSSAPSGNRTQMIKIIGSIVAVIISAVLMTWHLGGRGDPEGETNHATLIDSITKETMYIKLEPGSHPPFVNPKTGAKTLFRTERCYWTKDGKAKLEPTHVLLNEYAGQKGQTVCPDCGRPVRFRNPMPPMELMDDAAKANRRK